MKDGLSIKVSKTQIKKQMGQAERRFQGMEKIVVEANKNRLAPYKWHQPLWTMSGGRKLERIFQVVENSGNKDSKMSMNSKSVL